MGHKAEGAQQQKQASQKQRMRVRTATYAATDMRPAFNGGPHLYTPPTPENTLLGVEGVEKRGGGGDIKILRGGLQNIQTPPPPPKMGGGYIVFPGF